MTMTPEFDKFIRHIQAQWGNIISIGDSSWNGINTNRSEPQIVRSYLLDRSVGVDYLNRNLSPLLSGGGYEVKFASVYIHQKPRVQRTVNSVRNCTGDTPACELGDMMVIFCLLDANKKPIYRSAVLAQAKMDEQLTSQSQKCLYDSDISFDMPATIYGNSITPSPLRHFPDYSQGRPKALHYLVINPSPRLRFVPWSNGISSTWGVFLARMLNGDMGLPFTTANQGDTNWNCIVHDLLNIGSGKIPSSITRGSALINVLNLFNSFQEHENYSVEIQDAEGLPILFVIVKDNETTITEE